MKKKTEKVSKKNKTKKMVGLGVGIAVLGVASYLLFGPDGKKNQKKIKGWAIKMKGEIIEEFEKMKELTQADYHKIIDQIQKKYSKIKKIDKKELTQVVDQMKNYWKTIEKKNKKPIKKVTKRKISPKK
jgi:gas vesicle protein